MEITAQIDNLTDLIIKLRKRVARLTAERDAARREADELKAHDARYAAAVREQLQALEAEIEGERDSVRAAYKYIDQLTGELSEARREADELRTQLTELRASTEANR